ncbi:type I methionyl aminopeptidase [Jeotgalibacillus sp. R-1-5s-1]|uniref:type I methionyl aminopeptidase n=1 Tax=Jeotgalibacillus sp. R-1-5s-1 TaxID=2555897 RepID=UPI00106A479B|nr:type I methionyl aminopeptidase [Jeotgalibacillus sp. R-1-5s-1]TFD96630.1 type I methionyl aminopeptidase [Jeotgalibacillus sp. R-1-5s-1]
MIIQSEQDLAGLKEIGAFVASVREAMKQATVPGITTKELDLIAKEMFDQKGASSAPIRMYDFPGYTCISVHDEVAHGIPGNRVIKEGDLVNIDVSGYYNGYYADTGISFVVGQGEEIKHKLCDAAKEAFEAAMAKAKAGSKLNQIGKAVHLTAKKNNLTVIKTLTGHGIGKAFRDEPDHILNYFDPWDNKLLRDGLVLAVEPFVSTGAEDVITLDDGWTFKTPDGSLTAQYEHTIVVTKGKPIILTE